MPSWHGELERGRWEILTLLKVQTVRSQGRQGLPYIETEVSTSCEGKTQKYMAYGGLKMQDW